ncbi:unnamed protein product [Peronospora belbahrii]|uniref:lipid-A-disaccharide synthase n=1 Tax=Peronospora belbahrii TaxID=622444 RepID=A0AAU9LC25_9STRA|nr:unnamed protein product [Peronospora belbahrii]CAH0521262.1 unnamed protein product [Peronospora belbahrii]
MCELSTASPLKLYIIAGEASGDAIGAKVIRALQRQEQAQTLEFRGIGGSHMSNAGFKSLFPMQELSVMGLLEVVPHLWRLRRRVYDTVRDIEAFQPALVLTIDSKGFAFRVLKALQAREQQTGGKRIKKAHYVAPSVWAYKKRGKLDSAKLRQLLDIMFAILPFEEDIFHGGEDSRNVQGSGDNKLNQSWCHFVGHPAVEDFLEANKVYDSKQSVLVMPDEYLPEPEISTGTDALLDFSKYNPVDLLARARLFQRLAASGREDRVSDSVRENLGIPVGAFVICALVGSRANEVQKCLHLVLDGIELFRQKKNAQHEKPIFVVFPTISAVKEQVNGHISAMEALSVSCRVMTDLDSVSRFRLFQSSDAAVAVSGTIVLEAALANLPTVVVYRANRLTEWIAQWLAAVRFVSVPNLLLGRLLIPELLFSDCTALKIAETLTKLQRQSPNQKDESDLAMAASTLTKWLEPNGTSVASTNVQPIRASDLVAKYILEVLAEKEPQQSTGSKVVLEA